jgi:enoyl-CoA hydratase
VIEAGAEGLDGRRADGVLRLTFARPRARDALTIAMRGGLIEAVRAADADAKPRPVVRAGAP